MITINVPFALGDRVYLKETNSVMKETACPACKGRGTIPIDFEAYELDDDYNHVRIKEIQCETCDGTGQYRYICGITDFYASYIVTCVEMNRKGRICVNLYDEEMDENKMIWDNIDSIITEEEYRKLEDGKI